MGSRDRKFILNLGLKLVLVMLVVLVLVLMIVGLVLMWILVLVLVLLLVVLVAPKLIDMQTRSRVRCWSPCAWKVSCYTHLAAAAAAAFPCCGARPGDMARRHGRLEACRPTAAG